jgi:hypothetical protein
LIVHHRSSSNQGSGASLSLADELLSVTTYDSRRSA